MSNTMFYIGIDGGGTRCRARLESAQGQLLGEGVSGAANVMRSPQVAKSSIIEACERAIVASGKEISLDRVSVGAGLAGANIPSAMQAICDWSHPFADFEVLSDLHAACIGAHAGSDGAVIVCGTGSSGARYEKGQFVDVGGHGFLMGDMASGAWLGLQAVQHTLQVLDGIFPQDDFSGAVLKHLGCRDDVYLVQYCEAFSPKDFASLAPVIVALFNAKDPHALTLIARATDYLQRLADRLIENSSLPLSLIGGLSHIYQPHLAARTLERLVERAHNPEQGAIQFLKQKLHVKEADA